MIFARRIAKTNAQREQRLWHRREFLAQRVQPRFVAGAVGVFVLQQRLDRPLRADGAAGQEPGLEASVGFAQQFADGGGRTIINSEKYWRIVGSGLCVWHKLQLTRLWQLWCHGL